MLDRAAKRYGARPSVIAGVDGLAGSILDMACYIDGEASDADRIQRLGACFPVVVMGG